MLRSILIGLDNTRPAWPPSGWACAGPGGPGPRSSGSAIVDEPGIRAIEPVWPVGGKPGVDPVYYMGYEARLADVQEQVRQLLDQFAARCDEEGVAHAELLRSGSPHEQIREEAQCCDLIVLGRGSRFASSPETMKRDETLKRVLKDAPAPGSWWRRRRPCARAGPVLIAYDGSLQAARTLAAFEATGLGESAKVHVVSVGLAHAKRPRMPSVPANS